MSKVLGGLTFLRLPPQKSLTKLETFNGSVKKINLPSKGAVAQFINTYPNQLPVGVSVKLDCDALGIRGTLRGKAVL